MTRVLAFVLLGLAALSEGGRGSPFWDPEAWVCPWSPLTPVPALWAAWASDSWDGPDPYRSGRRRRYSFSLPGDHGAAPVGRGHVGRGTDRIRATRFPLFGLSYPVHPLAGTVTLTIGGFMDQRWQLQRESTTELGETTVPVLDRSDRRVESPPFAWAGLRESVRTWRWGWGSGARRGP
jgi:hypothetical protein